MWSPIERITVGHPLVFFHQRKAGGSSVRIQLNDYATHRKLHSYIACFRGATCDIYSMPQSKFYSIYGGHFYWGSQNVFTRKGLDSRLKFSCFTNIREPMSRMKSCLNFRHFRSIRGRCLNDLPLDELERLMRKPDMFGSSCLNEVFRIMSGVLDEDILDHIDETTLMGLSILNRTVVHLQKCPPLILGVPKSYDLLNQRFSADLNFSISADVHDNALKSHVCNITSVEHLELMTRLVKPESMIYEAVLEKVLSS
jgi:hypothetical protein